MSWEGRAPSYVLLLCGAAAVAAGAAAYAMPSAFYAHAPVFAKLGASAAEFAKLKVLASIALWVWAGSQFSACLSGPAAVATYCAVNVAQLVILAIVSFLLGDTNGCALWTSVSVAYVAIATRVYARPAQSGAAATLATPRRSRHSTREAAGDDVTARFFNGTPSVATRRSPRLASRRR